MKKCSKCGKIKPKEEYHKNKCSKDGFANWCKECRNNHQKISYKKTKEENVENKKKKCRENKSYNGEIINNKTIIDTKRIKGKPYHMFICNKCGYDSSKKHYIGGKEVNETWVRRDHMDRECGCCAGKIIVEGINDIATLSPEHIKYFPNGYEDAKRYGLGSDQRIHLMCPRCNNISSEKIRIHYMIQKSSVKCNCCKNISYPERFMYCLLEQLGIDFEWHKKFNWSNKKEYDFYLPYYNTIIETHGEQHYKEANRFKRTLEEEKENDIYKNKLALNNGIKNYIVIDCRKSNIKWIKNNILYSELNKLFNLNNVNWDKCDEFKLN